MRKEIVYAILLQRTELELISEHGQIIAQEKKIGRILQLELYTNNKVV